MKKQTKIKSITLLGIGSPLKFVKKNNIVEKQTKQEVIKELIKIEEEMKQDRKITLSYINYLKEHLKLFEQGKLAGIKEMSSSKGALKLVQQGYKAGIKQAEKEHSQQNKSDGSACISKQVPSLSKQAQTGSANINYQKGKAETKEQVLEIMDRLCWTDEDKNNLIDYEELREQVEKI